MNNSELPETYICRISSFMKWADRKLSEEIAKNDEMVKNCGTTDLFPNRKTRTNMDLAPGEKKLIIEKIDLLRSEGAKVKSAVKALGIHEQTYYNWKKKYKL